MTFAKRFVVRALERLCGLIDGGRPFYRCWLAEWSMKLDARWKTRVWEEPE